MARGPRPKGAATVCDHCGTQDVTQFKVPTARTCLACRRAQKQAATKRWAKANAEDIRCRRRANWLLNGVHNREVRRLRRLAKPELIRAEKRRYRARHEDRLRAKGIAYYRANTARLCATERARQQTQKAERPLELRAVKRAWREANRDKHRASNKRWKVAHPQAVKNAWNRRRAQKACLPATLTVAEWQGIIESFGHACAYCLRAGLPLTQDHVTAIARGGAHTADNIVPACVSCNARKAARGVLYMLQFKEPASAA